MKKKEIKKFRNLGIKKCFLGWFEKKTVLVYFYQITTRQIIINLILDNRQMRFKIYIYVR